MSLQEAQLILGATVSRGFAVPPAHACTRDTYQPQPAQALGNVCGHFDRLAKQPPAQQEAQPDATTRAVADGTDLTRLRRADPNGVRPVIGGLGVEALGGWGSRSNRGALFEKLRDLCAERPGLWVDEVVVRLVEGALDRPAELHLAILTTFVRMLREHSE